MPCLDKEMSDALGKQRRPIEETSKLRVEPPNRLSFAWDSFGWQVTFELEDLGGTTKFTLVHSGWGAADEMVPRAQQTHAAIREIMDKGWEPIVKVNLCKFVES